MDCRNLKDNPRIERLRKRYLAVTPSICPERAVIATKVYQQRGSLPNSLLRAEVLKRVVEEMSIWIADDELLVGNIGKYFNCSPIFPEYSYAWILEEMNSDQPFDTRSADAFQLRPEDREALNSIADFWRGRTFNDLALAMLPEETTTVLANSSFGTYSAKTVAIAGIGHHIPDFKKILEVGFLGLMEEARAKISALGAPKNDDDLEKYNFWRSMIIASQAAVSYARRYARLAQEMAGREACPDRKKELLAMARVCENVPARPASSFHEACQSLIFFQFLQQIEANGHSASAGRFDQYMYPFYKKDLDRGLISPDQALELIESVWLKVNEINKLRSLSGSRGAGGYPQFQNFTLGGQTREGHDATNDLSFLGLEATKRVALPEPSLSVRIWEGTPKSFWSKIVDVTRKGLGMPALFNDRIIISGMLKRGKTLEEARDYAIVGCVEPAVPGFEWSWAGGNGSQPYFNLPAVLEYAINDGKSLITGRQAGPPSGSLATFKSFEELKRAYEKQMSFFVDQFAVITNAVDLVHMKFGALPLLSCAMNDCLDRGLDVCRGGARYNATGTAAVGTGNVADSLMAIKKYVFDERRLTGAEMLDILKNNWNGHEVLRSEMQSRVPFYGNDLDEVDQLARFGTSTYCRLTERCRGPRGGYSPGLYPVSANVTMGLAVGASADGRRHGEPLADGISPLHGHDVNGPTAVLKSAAKLDHSVTSNGTLLNMRFHPSALEGSVGEEAIVAALKSYFELNGLHVQYNVVSSDTLREAQAHPEKYKDLVVRVAGYSALFVGLDPILQNDIIERTEFS